MSAENENRPQAAGPEGDVDRTEAEPVCLAVSEARPYRVSEVHAGRIAYSPVGGKSLGSFEACRAQPTCAHRVMATGRSD